MDSRFFEDTAAFQGELLARSRRSGKCWSCPSGDGPMPGFNTDRDMGELSCSGRGVIFLCPACAVSYMNSFNRKLHGEGAGPPWTVEKYLTFLRETNDEDLHG
jgi:hypothetical protein